MDFAVMPLLDQDACYRKLLDLLHPEGLACPRCAARDGLYIHRHRKGSPVLDHRCKRCGRVFNLFTGTRWRGTSRTPAEVVAILRGVAAGTSTAQLARELGRSRPRLLELRHRLQAAALAAADVAPLPDAEVEADEVYQNAGEKRGPACRPGGPAAAARQQEAGARHLGQRPAAAAGGGGPGVEAAAAAAGQADVGVGVGGVRHGDDAAGGDGVHRRVERVPGAEGRGPGARDGQPLGGGVRAG